MILMGEEGIESATFGKDVHRQIPVHCRVPSAPNLFEDGRQDVDIQKDVPSCRALLFDESGVRDAAPKHPA